MQILNNINRLLTTDVINTITIDAVANLIAIVLGVIIIILLIIRTVEYLKKDK